jgi:hypothetical protein
MRISVVVPSISDFYFSIDRMSSLGARAVYDLVRDAGYKPLLFDFPRMVKRPRPVPRPEELSYLNPFVLNETGPVSFFTRYMRLGPSPASCAQAVTAAEPDLLLVSCFAYAYAEDTLAFTESVRDLDRELTIAVGGAGASALPEKFLRSKSVTFVLTGEAETNLTPFLAEFVKRDPDYARIPGLLYREGERFVLTAPRREADESELGWHHAVSSRGKNFRLTTSLSRGCPRRCSFCSNFIAHGRPFRRTPLETVFSGIDAAASAAGSAAAGTAGGATVGQTSAIGADAPPPGLELINGSSACTPAAYPIGGITEINFEDDNLLADADYALEVIGYARRKFGAPRLLAENGIDAAFLNQHLLDSLIDLGLHRLNLSLASVDTWVLSKTSRRSTSGDIAEFAAQASRRGVETIAYFICGLPGETRRSLIDNLVFLASVEARIGISLFYPVPGIDGFEDPGVFLDSSAVLSHGSAAYPWTGTFSARELVTGFRLARFINLVKTTRGAASAGGDGGDSVEMRGTSMHQAELIDKTLRDRRLYTWEKNGSARSLVAVPNLDDDLTAEVIEGAMLTW